MINEEQLQEWERLANTIQDDGFTLDITCSHEELCVIFKAIEAVPALIKEVRRLAKLASEHFATAEQCDSEVDWLAGRISITNICANPRKNKRNDHCGGEEDCAKCWREAARKAVKDK